MLGELLLFAALVSISYAFYKWATLHNDFFEKRHIKYKTPNFLTGNSASLFFNKRTAIDFAHSLYESFPGES